MNAPAELFPDFKPKTNYAMGLPEHYNKTLDYYADNAEAVIFIIVPSGINPTNCIYVMLRHQAIKFLNRPETSSNNGGRSWSFCFTCYKTNWREDLDSFKVDDGRFDNLLAELGIVPIYVKKF